MTDTIDQRARGLTEILEAMRRNHVSMIDGAGRPAPRPLHEVRKEFSQFWVWLTRNDKQAEWYLCTYSPDNHSEGFIQSRLAFDWEAVEDYDDNPAIGIPAPSPPAE